MEDDIRTNSDVAWDIVEALRNEGMNYDEVLSRLAEAIQRVLEEAYPDGPSHSSDAP